MITLELRFKDDVLTKDYIFDKHNPNWTNSNEHNLFFLRAHQNHANDVLRSRGHVLLNDVLDSIGAPRTVAGAVFGWALEFGRPVYIEFHLDFDSDSLDGAVKVNFNATDIVVDRIEASHQMGVSQFNISHTD